MSSAAGLSAAKRRRGAGSSTTTSVPQKSTNVKKEESNIRVGPQVPGNMPPIGQVLYVHEERLRRLEKLTGDDDAEGNGVDDRLNREEFVSVVTAINAELTKMKQMVSDLQSNVLSNSSAIRSAKDNVVADVVADVTQELNSVSLTVEEGGEDKKKTASSSDS